MKIVIISGSPKGEESITLHYARYIAKHFPDYTTTEIHAGRDIRKYEQSGNFFEDTIKDIAGADGVLWTFPVYYLLLPGQMKRFIELIFERGMQGVFKDKYATALTTSVHFSDNTAHNYIHAVSEDLGMKYLDGFSAEMQDLHDSGKRLNLLIFAERFFESIKTQMPVIRKYIPVPSVSREYIPDKLKDIPKSDDKKVVVITDSGEGDVNLNRMIDTFRRTSLNATNLLDISKEDIKGGCLGCLHCSYDNTCVYHDGFFSMFEDRIKKADGIVIAGAIRDRYLSATWKTFFDRSFYNGHVPSLKGKQVGCIISGPLSHNENLRHIIESYTQIVGAHHIGIATDESGDNPWIDAQLIALADNMHWALMRNYLPPQTYLGYSGHLLFRDLIFGGLKFPFAADHKYYRRNRLYDYPHKKIRRRLLSSLMYLVHKVPGARRNIRKEMTNYMVKPYKKYVGTDIQTERETITGP